MNAQVRLHLAHSSRTTGETSGPGTPVTGGAVKEIRLFSRIESE